MSEPVAWAVPNSSGGVEFGKGWMFSPTQNGPATVPLYTRPPSERVRELVEAAKEVVNAHDETDSEPSVGAFDTLDRGIEKLRAAIAAVLQAAYATDETIAALRRDAELLRAIADFDGIAITSFLVQARKGATSGWGTAYFKAPPSGTPEVIHSSKLEALRAALSAALRQAETEGGG